MLTEEDKELINLQITNATCKIMSTNLKSSKKCSDLYERALIEDLSIELYNKEITKLNSDDK